MDKFRDFGRYNAMVEGDVGHVKCCPLDWTPGSTYQPDRSGLVSQTLCKFPEGPDFSLIHLVCASVSLSVQRREQQLPPLCGASK